MIDVYVALVIALSRGDKEQGSQGAGPKNGHKLNVRPIFRCSRPMPCSLQLPRPAAFALPTQAESEGPLSGACPIAGPHDLASSSERNEGRVSKALSS